MNDELPQSIGKVAARALHLQGLTTLTALAAASERELLDIDGVGPKAIRILGDHGAERGLHFRDGDVACFEPAPPVRRMWVVLVTRRQCRRASSLVRLGAILRGATLVLIAVVALTGCTDLDTREPFLEDVRSARLDARAHEVCLERVGGEGYTLIAALDSDAGAVRAFGESIEVATPNFDDGLPEDHEYVAVCIFDVNRDDIARNTVATWATDTASEGGVGVIALWDRSS